MKQIPPLRVIFLTFVALMLIGCGNTPTPDRFVIKDLVPAINLNEVAQSRFLVRTTQAGKLEAEVSQPTHRQEMIFLNQRVTLGIGKATFSPPPLSLEQNAPSTGFKAGMVNPDWFSGVEHILIGKITINDYVFESDPSYPLTFKIVKEMGYVYICGRGSVTTPQGKTQELGKSDTIALFTKRVSSENQLDREGAAQALGYLAAEGSDSDRQSAIKTLSGLLSDKAFEVRRDAIEALSQIGGTDAVPSLREIAQKDENQWVQEVAKWAIEKIESK
jgi:hypothetical protein